MQEFKISKGRLQVHVAYIEADTEEEAMEKAKGGNTEWLECENPEPPMYQFEHNERGSKS